jgi:hypothetical protein
MERALRVETAALRGGASHQERAGRHADHHGTVAAFLELPVPVLVGAHGECTSHHEQER